MYVYTHQFLCFLMKSEKVRGKFQPFGLKLIISRRCYMHCTIMRLLQKASRKFILWKTVDFDFTFSWTSWWNSVKISNPNPLYLENFSFSLMILGLHFHINTVYTKCIPETSSVCITSLCKCIFKLSILAEFTSFSGIWRQHTVSFIPCKWSKVYLY